MKTFFSLLLLFVMVSLPIPYNNHLVSGNEKNVELINSFEQDITGDGFEEYIRLHGNLLASNSTFYQNVWISIQNAFKKEWSISLQQGYQPVTTLIDLTGDKNPDIFYQVAKDEDLKHFHYQLYHLNQNKIKAIDLPAHQHLKGEFADNFIMKFSVDPTKEPISMDLSNQKEFYIKKGVYHPSGKIIKSINPTISEDAITVPYLISDSKGYGLKTTNTIYGFNNDDIIGTVETIWYFEQNQWVNIKTEVKNEL